MPQKTQSSLPQTILPFVDDLAIEVEDEALPGHIHGSPYVLVNHLWMNGEFLPEEVESGVAANGRLRRCPPHGVRQSVQSPALY